MLALAPASMCTRKMTHAVVAASRVPLRMAWSNRLRPQVSTARCIRTAAQGAPHHGKEPEAQTPKEKAQPSAKARRSPAFLSPSPGSLNGITPGFGRMGAFLRSIEDEMHAMMRGMEIGDGDLTPFKPFQEGFPLPLHVDVHNIDKEIVLKADVPGLRGGDIKLTYDPATHMLAVSGERNAQTTDRDESGRVMRFERRFGTFHREFKLPNNVHAGDITAKVTDGELEIHVPKTEEDSSKLQQITVE